MENSILATEAFRQLGVYADDCMLIDVRTPGEFESLHAIPAINIPLDNLRSKEEIAKLRGKKQLLCICQSGMRGKKAVEMLRNVGLSEVLNVEGGTLAWKEAGLPIVQGKSRMSIERQVRLAAGTLVLTGSLAAIFVSPVFLGLTIFVGVGLIFAGLTDTCGMALLLARCPWNK